MDKGNFRRLPVVKGGQLVGIVSDRDLRQHVGQLEHTRVDAVMAKPVITVEPDMLLDQAANLLVKHSQQKRLRRATGDTFPVAMRATPNTSMFEAKIKWMADLSS